MRRVRRVEFVSAVTPLGWGVAGLGAVCAVIGWLWGWLEFRTLAFLALALVVVAVLLTLRRAIHDVTLELHQPRVQVGEPGLGRVWIRGQRRGSSSATIELPVGRAVARFRVAALGADDFHEELFSIPTRRRGVVPVGPVRAVQADPVGLLQRERSLTTPQDIHIHPRTLRLGTVLHGVLRDIEGAVTQDLSSSDVAFHALRDYVPGDDRRNVHWRTTARTGRLMVRQFEETRRSSLLVLLSTRQDDYTGGEDFETAVSIACSLAMDAIQDGREVRFITQIGALPTSSALRMLDTSCLLSTGEDDVSCDLLVRHACTAHPEASIVVLVTGQRVDRATLARARGFAHASMVTVTLRAGQQGLSRHHAGTMPVVDMDRLEQLPTALRRAL